MLQHQHELKAKQMLKAGRTVKEVVTATDLNTTWVRLQKAKMRNEG